VLRPLLQVRHQHTLWERALELRILLQKPLAGSNRMPQPRVQQAAVAQDAGLLQQYSQLHSAAAETLQLLLHLHSALVANNPTIAAAGQQQQEQQQEGSKARGKRSRREVEGEPPGCSAMWAQVEAEAARCAPFCEQSLDKWHRRAVLSSGSALLRNSLRALNQSISSQVRRHSGRGLLSMWHRVFAWRLLCYGYGALVLLSLALLKS
jgi:hypothetical protein